MDVLTDRGRQNLAAICGHYDGEKSIDRKFLRSVKIRAHLTFGVNLMFLMKQTVSGVEWDPK